MSEWQRIETAPRDGTWFVIVCFYSGEPTFEVGHYSPLMFPTYVPVQDGLYKMQEEMLFEWIGFNNFQHATHWMPLPKAPE